jgi:dipeptidyl aminopeptidase/acylaminoacyl peptidase
VGHVCVNGLSIFVDSAFTERVLGPPEENIKGYLEADATQHARHVPNHALFLLHGLADLSTPYPHGIALARALSDAGVLFRYHVSIKL